MMKIKFIDKEGKQNTKRCNDSAMLHYHYEDGGLGLSMYKFERTEEDNFDDVLLKKFKSILISCPGMNIHSNITYGRSTKEHRYSKEISIKKKKDFSEICFDENCQTLFEADFYSLNCVR